MMSNTKTSSNTVAIDPSFITLTMIRERYLPVSVRTFDRWITCGKFPAPDIKIEEPAKGKTARAVRFWKRETVESWINARVEKTSKGNRPQLPS